MLAGAAGFEPRGRTAASKERLEQVRTRNLVTIGWGGRIRTCECRYQKPVPYHLATPQQAHPRMCGRGALIAKEWAKGSVLARQSAKRRSPIGRRPIPPSSPTD